MVEEVKDSASYINNLLSYPILIKTIPRQEPNISKHLIKFSFSFKNNVPNNKAKITEVSLIEETMPMGKYKHAQTTIAYAT